MLVVIFLVVVLWVGVERLRWHLRPAARRRRQLRKLDRFTSNCVDCGVLMASVQLAKARK